MQVCQNVKLLILGNNVIIYLYMNSIKANNFKTRTDLENHIRNLLGLTPEIKTNYKISGTKEELKRLQLATDSLFWGIKMDVTDEIKEVRKKVPDKIYRGIPSDYGINIKNKKIK